MAKQSIDFSGVYRKAILDTMDSLGDEKYAYYNISINQTADPAGRAKIFFALKVSVPRSERSNAAKFIAQNLAEKGYSAFDTKGTGNQLDVTVENKILRIDIKPVGGGSGAGAKETARNEAAQCVYCALAFNVYKSEIDETKPISSSDFDEAFKTAHVDVKREEIVDELPPDWVRSSIRGANALYNRLPKSKTYHFYRGSGLDDKEIKNAYGRVRKQTAFSSEDKWNPADIWIAERGYNPSELDAQTTIDGLNAYLIEKFTANELIGVSLKKVEGTPNLSEKNLDPVAKANRVSGYGLKKVGLLYENARMSKEEDKYPMDIYLYYGSGTNDRFQGRNFGGASSASFQLELKGASANQGRIGGGSVQSVLESMNITGEFDVSNNQQIWTDCNPKNKSKRSSITEEICQLMRKHDAEGFPKTGDYTQQFGVIANKTQSYRYSKLLGLRLLDTIKSSGREDEIIRELYLYAASESRKSGVYLKLQ